MHFSLYIDGITAWLSLTLGAPALGSTAMWGRTEGSGPLPQGFNPPPYPRLFSFLPPSPFSLFPYIFFGYPRPKFRFFAPTPALLTPGPPAPCPPPQPWYWLWVIWFRMEETRDQGPVSRTWINFNQSWICNYIHQIVWGEITYPFPNVNAAAVEVWEWINDITPHFTEHLTRKSLSWVIRC